MKLRRYIQACLQQERLNFWLTNYPARRLLTRFMGWFSKLQHPLLCKTSIAVWKFFADVDLSDARETEFSSLHACFTRRLKDGARPVNSDPTCLVSPCDGIVGMHGHIIDTTLLQAKGHLYRLEELLLDQTLADYYRNGTYVTLRLTSGMYHHFHAPFACHIRQVTYISGDTWNVNPPTLNRIEKLFCKNERAILRLKCIETGNLITLVPVAAVLVASIRLQFLDVTLKLSYCGADEIACDYLCQKGEDLGWFEHGSTVIVLAPPGYRLDAQLKPTLPIRMGQPLLHRTA